MPLSPLTNLTVVGAYGRDYSRNRAAALLADWVSGLDFKICNGPYFSSRDASQLLTDGYTQITFMARDGLRVCVMDLATQELLPLD